jgi:uncharacterized protein
LFENLIYLNLRRQGKDVFYYKTKSGHEIDFITKSKDGTLQMVQAVWDHEDPEMRQSEGVMKGSGGTFDLSPKL